MTVTWASQDRPLRVSSAVVLRCQMTVLMWQMQPWSSKLPLRTLLPLELLWAETNHSNQPPKLSSWRKIQQRSSSESQLLLCMQDVKSHIFKSFFLHNSLSLPTGTLCLSTFICLPLFLSLSVYGCWPTVNESKITPSPSALHTQTRTLRQCNVFASNLSCASCFLSVLQTH